MELLLEPLEELALECCAKDGSVRSVATEQWKECEPKTKRDVRYIKT